MSKKNIMLIIILCVLLAILTATLTVFGTRYFVKQPVTDLTAGTVSSNGPVVDAEVHFVDVSNVVITLANNTGRTKNYLLLDLVLLTHKEEDINRVETTIPLVRSATVDYLTNMNYQDISGISVSDLRNQLLEEYRKAYSTLHVSMPFNDVMISKMVFQ